MIVKPRAKVNLTLCITGRRADGYHTLDTVFQPISLCDEMSVERTEEFSFRCSVPVLENNDNLVCRAFRLFCEKSGYSGGFSVYLEKKIPFEAGLGGGSGDAAAFLSAMNELTGAGLCREELAAMGAHLGADVPALLYPHAMRGRGTGTELTPIRTTLKMPLLVVKPAVSLPTPQMFRGFDSQGSFSGGERSDDMEAALVSGDAAAVAAGLYNDFEQMELPEEIGLAGQALKTEGARGVLLSGSGSSVFGIFPEESSRDKAFAALKERWLAFPCETVNEGD